MANIFQQYAQPARSVMDYQADYDNQDLRREQLGAAKRTNELAALTADQTRQGMAESASERNILRQLAAQHGGDEQGFIRALGASGSPGLMKMAGEREKSALDRGKTTADTAKTTAETQAIQAKAKYEAADRLERKIVMVRTPDDLQAYEDEGIDLGIFPAERRGYSMQQAQHMGGIEQWKVASAKAAVSAVEQFKTDAENARAKLQSDTSITTTGMTNATSRATNAATNATSRANNNATVGATLQGQRSVAATAAAGREQSASQFTRTEARATAKDAAERTDGSKATESERNAAGYASRMTEATKLLDKYENGGRGTYSTEIAAGVPFVGNAMRTAVSSADQQQYRQAQEDWVRSKLRKESGASIAADEMEREISSYFPQPGESKGVIDQKRRARAVATEGMVKASGRAGYKSAVPPTGANEINFGDLK